MGISMSEFDNLLGEMDELLEEAWSVPMTGGGKCFIDREKLREYINGLQTYYPSEIRKAKAIIEERETILLKARTDAEKMIRDAEEKAKKMLDEEAVLKEAKRLAEEMLASAKETSDKMRKNAADYVDTLLRRLEEQLENNLAGIKQARRALERDE